jgi:two-component system, NtrC family, response regulator HydG
MQSFAHLPDAGRVLVVDDDPEAALFAAYVLEKHGRYQVTRTSDPAAALALAATGSWEFAVTDLDLPVLSGTELIAALRSLTPSLPVILVTSHGRDDIPSGLAGQSDAILVKPYSAERLLAAAAAVRDKLAS